MKMFRRICFGVYTFPFFIIGFFASIAAWGLVAGWGFGINEIEELLEKIK